MLLALKIEEICSEIKNILSQKVEANCLFISITAITDECNLRLHLSKVISLHEQILQ